MKIRNSPYLNEFVEFEVELNPINVEDSQGKDVTVNWKMLDGFDANKTFWTDANGLEMQKRKIRYEPTDDGKADPQSYSSNFYPVTSAIAMRDFSGNS
jgi:hypothetical protein